LCPIAIRGRTNNFSFSAHRRTPAAKPTITLRHHPDTDLSTGGSAQTVYSLHSMKNLRALSLLLAAAISLTTGSAQPVDKAELEALRAQVQQLEQQLKVLSRRLEIKEEAAAAAAPTTPKVVVNEKGVALTSADGANSLKVHGLAQLDLRLFFGDNGSANDAFVLRRGRFSIDGTFAKNYSYQLIPEFGGSTVSILDANFTVELSKAAQLKFGKFKEPIGLERLQSDSWTFFNERSIVTNLTPDRDLGIQLSGDLHGGRVNYAIGVFNGIADAATTNNTDFDNDKDVAARVMATPFKNAAGSVVQGLSFGVGGSVGRQKGTSGRTAGYKTAGQQTFFAYNSTVVADGQTWRVSPQLDYRNGPFGLQSEYIVSAVNLRPNVTAAKTEVRNKAWQVATGFVLTGEDSSAGGVTPRADFDFSARTWGAFEITARYADLKIDDRAFPLLASPLVSADEARAIGAGLNWYLSKVVAFKFDYYQTKFDFNALAPAVPPSSLLRQDEKALISRFQLSF
jgi:phosphate-selective porin OprO and OprP